MAAPPVSFAAIAGQNKPEEKALRAVEIDGHAALRILKHCQDCAPALVTGQLLGLDVGQTLEVTDCFPFPVSQHHACQLCVVMYWPHVGQELCLQLPPAVSR